MSNFIAADHPEKLFKFYDIGGDIQQLEFSISLFSVDNSFDGTFLSGLKIKNKFTTEGNTENIKYDDEGEGAPWMSSSSSSFGKFVPLIGRKNEEDGKRLEERRSIRWREVVPRPAIGPVIIEEEEEDEEEDHPLEEADEKEEEAVLEDPKQADQRARERQKGSREGRQRRHQSAISYRIFTTLEAEIPSITTVETEQGIRQQQQSVAGGSIRQRKIAPMESVRDFGQSTLKEPVQILGPEQRRRNRAVGWSEQRMRIMAYLGPEDAYDPSEEYLLWELRLSNGRRLITDADIDELRTVHSAKTGNTFRASMAIKDQQVKFDSLPEEEDTWRNEDEEDVGDRSDFEVPEGNDDYWLFYMVQLDRSVGFIHDNLCVEWILELPENCVALTYSADEGQQTVSAPLKGRTQRCAVKGVGRNDVAHFGHPIEFAINYRLRYAEITPGTPGQVWPRLLFRVTGEESWGRFYVDGYASLSLPTSPGTTRHISLHCWRPAIPNSKLCVLRETHLGQAVDLAGIGGLSGAKDVDAKWTSIYSRQSGLTTESSGHLELSVHCVHQSRHYVSRDILRSLKYSTMMRRIGISGDLQARIAKVLEEFERVRRQLIRARSVGRGKIGRRKGLGVPQI